MHDDLSHGKIMALLQKEQRRFCPPVSGRPACYGRCQDHPGLLDMDRRICTVYLCRASYNILLE